MKINKAFEKAKSEGRSVFIPYFILGFPNLDESVDLIINSADSFDILEIGIPFSDPVADGPTIQEGAIKALENNYNMEDFFKATKKIADKINKPIIYMLYYNQIFGYGIEKFMKNAKDAGVNGLIVPDMLPESDMDFIKHARKMI